MKTAMSAWWSAPPGRKRWARIRKLAGDMPLLIPGIGAQGGDLDAVLANGLTADGAGVLINASRSIIHAGGGDDDFAEAAAKAAETLCRQINRLRTRHRKAS